MSDPANVPEPAVLQHRYWTKEPATHAQMEWLAVLANAEGIELADLYGEGYRSMGNLSKYAAHWGIEILESRQAARAYEQARIEHEEHMSQINKAYIAHLLRMKNPGGEWSRHA